MNQSTVISIGCPSRSGSTMLDLMLGNAYNSFSLGEVYAKFRPFRSYHLDPQCGCGNLDCRYRKVISECSRRSLYTTCFEKFDVEYLIDSSKRLSWIIDASKVAEGRNYRYINVLIYKNPIELSHSFFKRGHDPMFWRNYYVLYYRRFFSTGMPFVAVNYNDFMAGLPDSLERLCTAINMPYFSGKERFWEKQHHHYFGSGGVRRLLQSDNPVLWREESFSPEFEAIIPSIETRVQNDSEVQGVSKILRENDVLTHDLKAEDCAGNVRRPFWYYKTRLREMMEQARATIAYRHARARRDGNNVSLSEK